jgi:uncharacterized tellurite resistance protein B-like protein
MISNLQSLLKKYVSPGDDGAAREESLRMAVSVLLMEVARAEDGVSKEERRVIQRILEAQHSVSPRRARELADAAERQAERATSLYPFTRLIVEECSLEERAEVIRMLWEVTFADGHAGDLEEHLIRKVAGLLYVPHRDFIRMKYRQGGS